MYLPQRFELDFSRRSQAAAHKASAAASVETAVSQQVSRRNQAILVA
jgi:hypothetical protein